MTISLTNRFIIMAGLLSALGAQAAPYSVTFNGTLRYALNDGQFALGDAVSGEILYDTNLVDMDGQPSLGNYPGATAKVWIRDYYFELAGAIITNANAVFSFSSQTPTLVPVEVLDFVEIGFFAPVLPGYGADLPTRSDHFDGAPELWFNFRSLKDGTEYYDVVVASEMTYHLAPVPEADTIVYFLSGSIAALLAWRRLGSRKHKA